MSKFRRTVAVRRPTIATLKKYGLSVEDWQELFDGQGGVCAVCGKVPENGGLVIDHEQNLEAIGGCNAS